MVVPEAGQKTRVYGHCFYPLRDYIFIVFTDIGRNENEAKESGFGIKVGIF